MTDLALILQETTYHTGMLQDTVLQDTVMKYLFPHLCNYMYKFRTTCITMDKITVTIL